MTFTRISARKMAYLLNASLARRKQIEDGLRITDKRGEIIEQK